MDAPKHLGHKPILEVADYNEHDGVYDVSTDAKALSIGLAQWDKDDEGVVSVKVWRNNGTSWKPNSEEMPLHRALDMAYLVALAYDDVESHRIENYRDQQVLPSYTDFTIRVSDASKTDVLKKYVEEHQDTLRKRLKVLKDKLNAMPDI